MAVPRTIPQILLPSLRAEERDFKYTELTASALPYPSAEASNVWHVEVGERTPPFIVPRCCSGAVIKLAAATMAPSHSPFFMALTALWRQ